MTRAQHCGSVGLVVVGFFVVAGCGGADSAATPDSKKALQELPGEPVDSPQVLATMIDDYAGHPDDPQLPQEAVGASDEALLATNSREIADLLDAGASFARQNADKPRFLFALGRAALFHGYERLANELLTEAADKGSGAASAYLGFQAEDRGDFETARKHLQTALERHFDTPSVRQTLAALTGAAFNPGDFNRPDLIKALHEADLATLRRDTQVNWLYVGTLHNTLWSDSILFVIDDPNIFLELDPAVSAKAGFVSKKVEGSLLETIPKVLGLLGSAQAGAGDAKTAELAILLDQATQDARRLALLYEKSPQDFRRVYRGIQVFMGSANAGKVSP